MNHATENGFTLLEILVSLSIIALVFVTLFRMQAASVKLVEAGNFHLDAARLAGNILNVPDREIADSGETSGGFDGEFKDWKWTRSLGELPAMEEDGVLSERGKKSLKRVDLFIEGGGRILTLTTWRYLADERD